VLLKRFGATTDPYLENTIAANFLVGPSGSTDPRVALQLCDRSLRGARPEHRGRYLGTKGIALYRAGRYREAVDVLLEAMRIRGADVRDAKVDTIRLVGSEIPEDWIFLAMAYYRLKDEAKARTYLQRFLTRVPRQPSGWQGFEIALYRREVEELMPGLMAPPPP
jgi:tetratricopeptide (TPR) repeat protein